jgi:hypothetical protein
LRQSLRHELCHALERQEALANEERWRELLDDVGSELFESGYLPVELAGSSRSVRSEAFARFCDLGPVLSIAHLTECPGDPPDVDRLAQMLATTTWAVDLGEGASVPWEGAVSHDVGTAIDELAVEHTADPQIVQLEWTVGEDDGQRQVELGSGVAQEGPPLPTRDVAQPLSWSLPGEAWIIHGVQVEGHAGALVRLDLHHLGLGGQRLLLLEDGEWRTTTEVCLTAPSALFGVERVWVARARGARVEWTPVGGEP